MLRKPVVRDGQWRTLDCTPAWDGNWTSDCFLVFAWQGPGNERLLVTVNYAPNRSQCYVFIATLTAALVTNSGRSAWFVGALTLMVYLIFAMTLYLLPPQVS